MDNEPNSAPVELDPVSRGKLEAEWNEMQQYAMLQREESQRATKEGLLKALHDRKQALKAESKEATRALPLSERLINLVAADVTNMERNQKISLINRAVRELNATKHRYYTTIAERQEDIRKNDQANVLQHGTALNGGTGELAMSRADWVKDQAQRRMTSAGLQPATERTTPSLDSQEQAQSQRAAVYERYVDNVVHGRMTFAENYKQTSAVFEATRQIEYNTTANGAVKDAPELPEVSSESIYSQQDIQAAARIDQRAEIVADLTPAEHQAELQMVVVESWVTADRSDLQLIQAEEVRESAEGTISANVETYADYANALEAQLQAEQTAVVDGDRTAEPAPAAPAPAGQAIEMPEFTHNGQRATLDLSRFETVEERARREAAEAAAEPAAPAPAGQAIEAVAAEPDVEPFGAPLEAPQAAPAAVAAEAEAEPFGAPLEAPQPAPAAVAAEAEADPFGAPLETPQPAPAAVAAEAEADPFGAPLETPQPAPAAVAAEAEAEPFGAPLETPQPAPAANAEAPAQAAPSPVSEMEGVELNSIEPVQIRVAANDARAPLDAANAASIGREEIVLDEQTRINLARMREADRLAVQEQLGHGDAAPRVRAPVEDFSQTREVERPARDNQVESDEILTAPKETEKPILPPDVQRDYVNVGNKYYNQKNLEVVAFEDKGNKLETRSNNEEVAANLVKIAEARGWDEIKVTGSEKFRKEVWMEAAVRGMHVKGYTPSEADKASLAARTKNLGANSVEPTKQAEVKSSKEKERAESFKNDSKEAALKKHPELAGAYAAQAAALKKLDADKLSPAEKQHVRHRITENITNSIEKGNIPEVQKREGKTAQRGQTTEMEQSR